MSYVEKALGLALLLLILVVGCVLVLMPFLNAILLAVTLCVSTWPLIGGPSNRKERAHECFRLNGSTAPAVCSGLLKGKSAVVTGSTSGIGLGIAEALAAAGANVLLNGFGQPAEVDRVRRSLAEAHGVRVSYSAADMSKPAEVDDMIAHATRDLAGGVDILVNNAGIQHTAPVREFPIELPGCDHRHQPLGCVLRHPGRSPCHGEPSLGRIVNIASRTGSSHPCTRPRTSRRSMVSSA